MSPSTVSQYCTGVDERHRQEEHSTAQGGDWIINRDRAPHSMDQTQTNMGPVSKEERKEVRKGPSNATK